jgi:hypothetical protein
MLLRCRLLPSGGLYRIQGVEANQPKGWYQEIVYLYCEFSVTGFEPKSTQCQVYGTFARGLYAAGRGNDVHLLGGSGGLLKSFSLTQKSPVAPVTTLVNLLFSLDRPFS